VDGFSEADADEFPVEPMDLDFEGWGDEDGTALDLFGEDPGELGDAEMDDIDQDDSSEWGLTDGESESMSSSEGDAGQDEESVRALVTLSVSIHEDEDAHDVDDESLNLTSDCLASEEPK